MTLYLTLRALEREEQALDAVLKAALADPSPSLPQDAAFAALRARHAERCAA